MPRTKAKRPYHRKVAAPVSDTLVIQAHGKGLKLHVELDNVEPHELIGMLGSFGAAHGGAVEMTGDQVMENAKLFLGGLDVETLKNVSTILSDEITKRETPTLSNGASSTQPQPS